MTSQGEYLRVLESYSADYRPGQVELVGGAGGFSGARLWRLETAHGRLCLRRWPREHPTRERLEFIHQVLWHVDRAGFHRIPVPLKTRAGGGCVEQAGHLWELTPWLPGQADYRLAPSPARLRAALVALAEFHLAAGTFPLRKTDSQSVRLEPAPSPGILERIDRLRGWSAEKLRGVSHALERHPWPELAQRAARVLELFPLAAPGVRAALEQAGRLRVPLQPCIRDIWHDHVLFIGDPVSGLIDFGAMRPDSVSADVARLLGSLAGDDVQAWQQGLAAYAGVRTLSASELLMVTAFDRSGILLSSLNWLEWTYLEQRHFENPSAVLDRLDQHLPRLERLASGEGA